MEHGGFLAILILAPLLSQVNSFNTIKVEETEDKVFLSCNKTVEWLKGTQGNVSKKGEMNLGQRMLDPRGKYRCKVDNSVQTLQLYYRMCQNCVELDVASLAGIAVTDIIATLLLALGVYCFAGHETGRRISEAADTQGLMRNDQLYQTLGDRKNDQYSSLGENWQRKK